MLAGVGLIESIELNDIDNKPDPELLRATAAFDIISDKTLIMWEACIESRRQHASVL